MTCDLARQGGLPSVRLQPSHGTPSQLRVTSWGPLCCRLAVCAPCATVGVSCTGGHLVQPGTQPSCRPRREHHVLDPPLPTRNLLGAWEVAGPTPQLSVCCSSSQLFPSLVSLVLALGLGPGPFPPTSSPPSFPSIIALFNRSARPRCQYLCFARLCSLPAASQ